MKKTIILTLLTFLTLGTRAGDYQYLVFTLTDGTTKAVTANSLTISFTDGNLVAASSGETLATLPLSSLTQMEFSTDGTTGIEGINANTLITDSATAIYDMNGRQMSSGSALPKGVYIVKTQNRTLKVNIK